MTLRACLSAAAFSTIAAASLAACSSSSSSSDGGDDPLTFAQAIEPLVQEKCQSCHREGGIAPFALVTYEDVRAMGEAAKGKVERREMPPWGAFDDPTCTVNHSFRDDLTLTDEQIDLFVRWVDRGMPLGNPAKRPPARTFAATGLVDKTASYQLPAPYAVTPGKDDIRCFPIDPGFAEDTWIGGSNVVPGDPRVVHHVIVYVDPKRQGVEKAAGTGSYPCFGGPDVQDPSLLLAWAPGVPPTTYGEEAGLKIPKGAHLVMQVHYHPGYETVNDQTSIELKTLSYKPGYVAQVILAGNAETADGVIKLLPGPNDPPSGPAFIIPSNVKGHTESMELVIPEKIGDITVPDLGVYAVGAHMHWAGVDMKIEVERKAPQGAQPAKECLLGTPKYDFNWQRAYQYDAPLDQLPTVGPGDKLRFTCTYDNTTGNRHVQRAMSEMRMSSPPEIKLGETTLDEMCLGVLVTVRRASLLD
ncbi:MAG: hypothetical protein KF795_05045 [Labilithrix sp.]|nr:hypothetical protein [Labilithrix sp.]